MAASIYITSPDGRLLGNVVSYLLKFNSKIHQNGVIDLLKFNKRDSTAISVESKSQRFFIFMMLSGGIERKH